MCKKFYFDFYYSMKINQINNISFRNGITRKTSDTKEQKGYHSIDLNALPDNAINKSLVKVHNAQLLKPKHIQAGWHSEYENCSTEDKKNNFNYIQINPETDIIEFKKELNPTKLPLSNEKFKGFEISNFYQPNGSIAIQTRLKSSLMTSGLYQCAAISLVDKEHNLQTLLHLCPTINKNSNLKLLKYLVSNCDKNKLEVSIVPGCDNDTDGTITLVMDFLKENCPNAKINFMDFPDDYHDTVVLHNGILQCLDKDSDFEKFSINPFDKIIYA